MIQAPNRITTSATFKTPLDFLRCTEPLHPVGRERIYVFTLTEKHSLIEQHLLLIGSITHNALRDILRYTLYDGATDFAVVRCRTEDSPRPTEQERRLAQDLQKACEVIGMEMFDFLLVGLEECLSFAEEGEIGEDFPF